MDADTIEYYKQKDLKFEQRKQTGDWPADSCESCKRRRGCCEFYNHHIGDCCLHCGNDERKL